MLSRSAAHTLTSQPDVDSRCSGVSTGTAEKEQQSHDDDDENGWNNRCADLRKTLSRTPVTPSLLGTLGTKARETVQVGGRRVKPSGGVRFGFFSDELLSIWPLARRLMRC